LYSKVYVILIAVKATVDGGEAPGNIKTIVEKIKPTYEKVKGLSDW
jgi:carbonic anhydrase